MYIKRKIEYQINSYLNSPEIIAIVGPRQCGKTTLLKHIAQGLPDQTFISFEDIRILQMFEGDIDNFISLYVKGKKYLFIDEFQYSKKGGKKLKFIFDSEKIKVFISGSSSIDLTVHALKYLVGRILIFNLYQFDFEEFIECKNPKMIPLLKSGVVSESEHLKLVSFYEEYAIYGGYPRVVLSDNTEEKKEVLKNIFSTYFLREVKDILGLIDDYKLSRLIEHLAAITGNLIDYKNLSIVSEFTYKSLKKYINFLEKTFICHFIKPYFRNKTVEIVKNPKVFFCDNGLRNSIVNDFRGITNRSDGGALLENAVFQDLLRTGKNVKYWRTKKKQEVDFIVESENKALFAFEVKLAFGSHDTDNLNIFAKKYQDAKKALIYFNRNDSLNEVKKFTAYSVCGINFDHLTREAG